MKDTKGSVWIVENDADNRQRLTEVVQSEAKVEPAYFYSQDQLMGHIEEARADGVPDLVIIGEVPGGVPSAVLARAVRSRPLFTNVPVVLVSTSIGDQDQAQLSAMQDIHVLTEGDFATQLSAIVAGLPEH